MSKDLQRLRDIIGGVYALIEEEQPDETEIAAARTTALIAWGLAKKICDREVEETLATLGVSSTKAVSK